MSDPGHEQVQHPDHAPGERHVLLGMLDQVGGLGAAIDSAVPTIVFAVVFASTGRSLRAAVWSAVAVEAVVLLVRLVRREPLRNAVGGFVAVAAAAGIARATGRAQDYYVVSLVRAAGELVFFAGSVLIRYPVIGLLVGLARGNPTGFRSDPAQRRAYDRATAIWAALFALRLAVRAPLYFSSHVGWLGVTDVVMGWPLFVATILATYVYLRRALHADHWDDARTAILARGGAGRRVADPARHRPDEPGTADDPDDPDEPDDPEDT